jgi:hypothetical protein
MIRMIKLQLAATAVHHNETENPDNRYLEVQGSGTG